MPKLGLVTVLFKSDDVLEGFYRSLSAQTFTDYHLYIIDNSPSPKTDALIQSLQLKYPIAASTHLRNNDNVGVAKGNNQGIQGCLDSGCSHVLLLNNDIEFHQPDLLARMLAWSIEYHEKIIVPKIYFYDSKKIWLAGGKFNAMKGVAYHVGLGDEEDAVHNIPGYFDYAPTCFMLLDRNVFNSVGMMDEKYFVYYDDTDFIYRAGQRGVKVYYMPSLSVLHKVNSSTGGGETVFSIFYLTRNRLYFIRKNLTGMTKISALFYTLFSRVIRSVNYNALQRQSMVKAIKAGFKM